MTKDADFNELATLRGSPPKIIWLRIGNCTTAEVEATLRNQVDMIRQLVESPTVLSLVLAHSE